MISREMRRITCLLVIAVFGAFLIHSAAAQEKTGSIQSAEGVSQRTVGGLTQRAYAFSQFS